MAKTWKKKEALLHAGTPIAPLFVQLQYLTYDERIKARNCFPSVPLSQSHMEQQSCPPRKTYISLES